MNINLSSSMHLNLLSLQQTQKLMSATQLKLSTGLKVNSAIDNPASYYTASALNNRASDLSALLDSMGQAVQTIKAATQAIESGTKMLDQAKAVANQALEKDSVIIAKVKTEAELLAAVESGKTGFIVIAGDINLTNTIALKDGQSLVGDNYFADYNGANRKLSFDFTGKSGDVILAGNNSTISNLDLDYQTDQQDSFNVILSEKKQNVEISNLNINVKANNLQIGQEAATIKISESLASLNGSINIASNTNYYGYGIQITSGSRAEINANLNIKTTGAYGYGIATSWSSNTNLYGNVNIETQGTNGKGIMILRGGSVNIYKEINIKTKNVTGIEARFETNLNHLNNVVNLFSGAKVYLDVGSAVAIASGYSLHSKFNEINFSTGAKIGVKDNLGTVFAQATKDILEINTSTTTNKNFKSNYFVPANGFDNAITPWVPFDFSAMVFTQVFNANNVPSTEESTQYNSLLTQYDMLISDSSYKGTNLLKSDNLSIGFNESRTSKLDINGVDASTIGLSLKAAKWESRQDVETSIKEITNAINQLRSFASYFGNNYSIIQTREEFTSTLINTLTEGADKLTLADMNEESADMLTLQTRQQLAINALSLASQASQGVLKLF